MAVSYKQSSAPLRTIKEIQFGLMSPEEIKRMSVVEIRYAETMVCAGFLRVFAGFCRPVDANRTLLSSAIRMLRGCLQRLRA